MSRRTPKPEKKRERKETEQSNLSVKWWGEKLRLVESKSPSLPVVAPRLGLHSIVQDRRRKGMGGGVKSGHTRGVCHIVWRWHLRRPTGPRSGQPATAPVLPEGSRVPVASRRQTRAPSCPAVDSEWTGPVKSSLCFGSRSLTSFSVFMGKSFQFPFPNHESAGQRRHQCRRLCVWNQRMTNFLINDRDRSDLPASYPYFLVHCSDLDFCTGRVFPSELPAAL